MGMRGLINPNDCLRYSLIPPVMVSMFGDLYITSVIMKIIIVYISTTHRGISFIKLKLNAGYYLNNI